jgi:hypothetical protein
MMRTTRGLADAGTRVLEPHTRVMVAVLQTVVDDCTGSRHRRAAGYGASADRGRLRDAIAYVASEDRAWPFSFENICDALEMDIGSLRRELQRGQGI